MKTSPKRLPLSVALACAILALGLEVALAGPQPSAGKESRRARTLGAQAPNTTFTENVIIDTGVDPTLTLNQNTSLALPAYRWNVVGNQLNFFVQDFTAGTYPFGILPGAPSDSLNVTGNGNVGIGVPFPNDAQQALHIVRGDTPTIRLEQDTTGMFDAHIWDLGGNDLGFSVTDFTNLTRPLFIFTGAPTDSLTIDSTGNIGVGTTGPQGRLHVFGTGTQLSIFQSSDDGAVQFRLQTDSVNRRFVALNTVGQQQSQLVFGDNGAFDFLGATASDVRMRFLANGNVGIGTTAPTQKLSVNGSAGKPGGGSWSTFSDERLKNIKGEFTSGLDAVMKLHPIRYEYKADNALALKSEGEHIGFGAAAVEKVIPEAVTKNADGYLMIDNDPILWTMLNAIKEQNAQIQDQNARMNAQNAHQNAEIEGQDAHRTAQDQKIARLEEQLARLQAQVALQAENQKLSREQAVAHANR